jgi:two-component system sensor histidine kinase ChvG
MPHSTKSKPSTGSDTATKIPRWYPSLPRSGGFEASTENLMDLYWGGPQRRITGLTIRILGVNLAALLALLIGVLYLGQVEKNLIEARLETFQAETQLIAAALSQEDLGQPSKKIDRALRQFAMTSSLRIVFFSAEGDLAIDSRALLTPEEVFFIENFNAPETLYTVQLLKDIWAFIRQYLPGRSVLETYQEPYGKNSAHYPAVLDALQGVQAMQAWQGGSSKILLTAALPVYTAEGTIKGAIFVSRQARDIERDVGDVWLNILRVFACTLAITAFLSIYLSGVIARPLRKLAAAAESMRAGRSQALEIPDLSYRHDEIGELSTVLRDLTQALWDRIDSIERFAADVAHELKNPLTSLRSAVETAAIVKKPEDRERLMQIILKDVMRMDRLITDISSASRLDAELSRESLQRISLNGVLWGVLDSFRDPIARANGLLPPGLSHEIDVQNRRLIFKSGAQGDVMIWGLEGRLAQVFRNLIENALSFTPEGGAVTLHLRDQGSEAVVTVADTGPGIPENRLQHIFERFYSERPGHEDFGNHSGLGLTIARQIITALGGQIFAENIKNAHGQVDGAMFTVILNKA